MSDTLSTREAKELLRLCKLGRLFDVQRSIASEKSICVPDDLRTNPLKVALDTGFHSLVELAVRNKPNSELKNQTLRHALSLKRLDFIQLLVEYRADPSSIEFIEVLRIWEPTIIRFFLDHAADFVQGFPFSVALVKRFEPQLVRDENAEKNTGVCFSASRAGG